MEPFNDGADAPLLYEDPLLRKKWYDSMLIPEYYYLIKLYSMTRNSFRRKRKSTSVAQQTRKNTKAISMLNKGIESKHLDVEDLVVVCEPAIYSAYFFNTNIFREMGADTTLGRTDTREGDEIQNQSLFIRGYFDNKVDVAAPEDVVVRIVIGKCIALPQDTQFAHTMVFANTDSVNSVRELDNAKNVIVKFDHTFSMDHVNFQQIPFKYRLQMQDITQYKGQTTNQVTTNVQENLYFMLLHSSAGATNDAPRFRFDFRYTYKDA